MIGSNFAADIDGKIVAKKVIINEYLSASEQFLEKIQIGFLNAILDKIAKELRKDE